MADNNKKSFFTNLRTLFSTNVVVRNVGGKKLKVIDTARNQSEGNPNQSKVLDRYGRIKSGASYTSVGAYRNTPSAVNKIELYADYERMDSDPIISSALDIYADESCLKDDFGNIIAIKTDDGNIRKILENLFYDILNIENNLWAWVRHTCKYGDLFLQLDIEEGLGVKNCTPLSSYEVERVEGNDPDNMYLTTFIYQGQMGNAKFENYEVAHFRLYGDFNTLPYGRSMLENARMLFRQLCLLEDAMLIQRITRAPEKRVFKIDVGNLQGEEVEQLINKVANETKKVPLMDPVTGQYNLRFNMQNLLEDFYLPVRGGQAGTDIETLPGLQYQAIEDIEYLQKKLFAALKVPKAFLGYEEGLEGKSTLAQLDIRFARTVERLQSVMVSELTKIAVIHLYSQGYHDSDLVNFQLSLTGPSIIYEQERLNMMKERVDLATSIRESKFLSMKYVYANVFNLSDDEARFQQNEVVEDLKQAFRLKQIEDEGNDPVLTKEAVGTPHALASMHVSKSGRSVQPINDVEVPEGGWPGAGRPEEHRGNHNTDANAFGRDSIGRKSVQTSTDYDLSTKHTFKKGKPVSLESLKMSGMPHRPNVKNIIAETFGLNEVIDPIDDASDGDMYNSNSLVDDI
jgi:hypothetical protein